MRTFKIWASVAALMLFAQPALAAVLIDNSPTSASDFGNELVNQAQPKTFIVSGIPVLEEQQNILVQITLASAMTLNGFDTFSRRYGKPAFPVNLARPIGTDVTLKIRADVGGRPADTNLFRLSSVISETSGVFPSVTSEHMRLHADFAETTLAAGVYWIGMSGTNTNLSWLMSGPAPGLNHTYNLFGERVNADISGIGTSNFRVSGFAASPSPGVGGVPEPATWAMLISGFALVGGLARRRRSLSA